MERKDEGQPEPQHRGFAAMDPEKQRAIASSGGKAAHAKRRAHEFGSDEAREAGRKGGQRVSRDRGHMAAIGRKGGASVSKNREHMVAIGRRGGQAVSEDRNHMAQIGRKGGASRTAPAQPVATEHATTQTPANDRRDERDVA
jgi:hypothetical protein